MDKYYGSELIATLRRLLEPLYGAQAGRTLDRLTMMLGRYGVSNQGTPTALDERSCLLITYPDPIRRHGEEAPLVTLKRFLDGHLAPLFSHIHILPFFPYSSDDGFSVIHYRQVNPAVGNWENIKQLSEHFSIVFDLVLNHVSSQSGWFQDFQNGIAPAKDYFITVLPGTDLSSVIRPRSTPLLTTVLTKNGESQVWTTFSSDQIDLNFANPDVLAEILDIMLFYISQGAKMLRLDAIGYCWKKNGTTCLNLPEAHALVKIIHTYLQLSAPDVLLLTETNVPHPENIRYFGSGDEAHLIYQFSLPPLILHSLLRGTSRYLNLWLESLVTPPPGCTFLNFTASHDGIGVMPLQGVLPAGEITQLLEEVTGKGLAVSWKTNSDGTKSPYEINATYYSALADDKASEEENLQKFLLSQAIVLALKGMPAIYINSLFAARNDEELAVQTGQPRSVNRHKWTEEFISSEIRREGSIIAKTFDRYCELIKIRAACKAFHPEAEQVVLKQDERLLCLRRSSGEQEVVAVYNLSRLPVQFPVRDLLSQETVHNLVSGDSCPELLSLAPYAFAWLTGKK